MTSISYPSPAYNGGALTDLEFERLVTNQAADGLIGTPSDPARVYADGTGTRRVNLVANRRALVRGYLYDSGATDIPLTLAANTSGVTRVDLIVLRLDRSTWKVTEAIKQGTPGSGSPAPTYDTGSTGVWELPLATVTVANNATTLSAGNVVQVAWYIGDDGQILCTPSTRPPGNPGRQIHEIDTDVTWESTGVNEPWRVPGNMVAVNSRTERDNFGGKYDGLGFWRKDLDRLDVWTGSGWRIFARPTQASVNLWENQSSVGYADLATVGPTVTVETGDAAEVTLSAQMIGPGPDFGFVLMAFEVSGATSIAPNDGVSLAHNSKYWIYTDQTFLVTGLNPGSNTFKAKYRTQHGSAGFNWRRIKVRPV